jgi:hypothetical protein
MSPPTGTSNWAQWDDVGGDEENRAGARVPGQPHGQRWHRAREDPQAEDQIEAPGFIKKRVEPVVQKIEKTVAEVRQIDAKTLQARQDLGLTCEKTGIGTGCSH